MEENIRKSRLILFLFFLLFYSCDPSYYYYSDISIQNSTSFELEDIHIEYKVPWINKYETVGFSSLLSNEKSEYKTIRSGYQFKPMVNGVANYSTIPEMNIYYTSNGFEMFSVIFDDGLYGGHVPYPDHLTEELEEKVYIKINSINTILITDNGVELLQGE